jgi:hypothetical protein
MSEVPESPFAHTYAQAMASSLESVRCVGGNPEWVRAHIVREFLLACFAAGDSPARLSMACTAAFKTLAIPQQLTLLNMAPGGSA